MRTLNIAAAVRPGAPDGHVEVDVYLGDELVFGLVRYPAAWSPGGLLWAWAAPTAAHSGATDSLSAQLLQLLPRAGMALRNAIEREVMEAIARQGQPEIDTNQQILAVLREINARLDALGKKD